MNGVGGVAAPSPDLSLTARPRAYVYHGEWVADCPREGCGNTEWVTEKPRKLRHRPGTQGRRKGTFVCSYCLLIAPLIDWPDNADDLTAVLDRRPVPHTRNWYPEGHPTAVGAGVPHGQSVAELEAESREHGVR